MASQPIPRLTEEAYLRIERAAPYRSEFIGGEMFAMAGGTARHARLAMRIGSGLEVQLEGKRCRTYSSDMRVLTPITGDQTYPDLSVVCGPAKMDGTSTDILTNPTLIVEVLSPTTADHDRGTKFDLYQQIPSFTDYLTVYQNAIRIDHYARQADGSWVLRSHQGEDARVPLPSIECELHLGAVFAGVMDEPG